MVKPNYQLDYTKCTAEELRSFIKARNGKNCTSNNVKYLAAQLRALDRTVTFRFLDLPTELKLEVYGELLDLKNPSKSKQRHLQILRTCKEIRREAEPELYKRVNLPIELDAYSEARMPWSHSSTVRLSIGGFQRMHLDLISDRASYSPLGIVEKLLPRELGRAWNVSLAIRISALTRPGMLPGRFNQVLHILFAITAVLRTSKVRSFNARLETTTFDPLWGGAVHHIDPHSTVSATTMLATLWPLYRIKTKVAMSLQGFPDDVSEYILSRRLEQDSVTDSLIRYKIVMPNAEKVQEILSAKYRELFGVSTDTRKHIEINLATLRRHTAEVRRLGPSSTIPRDDDSKACETLRSLERFLDRPSLQALIR